MKKSISILLTLALLLGLLAGCGGQTVQTPDGTNDAATPADTAGDNTPADTPAEDETPAELPEVGQVQLPIAAEPVTFSGWITDAAISAKAGMVDVNDCLAMQVITKKTNVNWDWEIASAATAAEKLNLILVSGDYNDVFFTYRPIALPADWTRPSRTRFTSTPRIIPV